MFQGARILVGPLDWGLGHATRCIPIIEQLLAMDARPLIGADKAPLSLLRDAFPALPHVPIPGVEVRYAKGASQAWKMAAQFPAMLRSVRQEHQLFLNIRRQHQLDAVISDQRFGLHAPGLPSVIITHQVFPFTPVAQGLMRRINLRSIARFDRCWIPDTEEAPGLAGDLSHTTQLPKHARYIGPVSRMDPLRALRPEKPYRVVCVISGPEPQRTLLENELMRQLPMIPGDHLLVLGQPALQENRQVGAVHRVAHLPSDRLAGALMQAELIVTRTGYTTLMDLAHIGRRALLVPTPGQEEQEYLGRLHAHTGAFIIHEQHKLDIPTALLHAKKNPAVSVPSTPVGALLERALQELATLIRTPHA